MDYNNLVKPEKAIVPGGYVSKKEVFGFCFGGFGQNLIYMLVSTYIMFFFTEVALVNSGWSSTKIVSAATIIVVIARVWDAINDMMMGSIVDNTKPNKRGKFRPYLLATPVLMATFTILCFVKLGDKVGPWFKVIWCAVTYIMWGMTYTISDIPMWGLTAAISPLPEERSKFLNLAKVLCSSGGMVGMIFLSLFIGDNNFNSNTYLYAALIIGLCGSAMFITMGTMCREKVATVNEHKSFKDNLSMLKKNKPLFLIFISGILAGARGLAQSAATYIATYNYQGVGINLGFMELKGMALTTVLGAGFGGGLFIGMMLVPLFQKKWDNKHILIYSTVVAAVAQFVLFLVPFQKIGLVSALLFFAGLPYGMYLVLIGSMLIDCVQYYEWKTGERTEGFCFSIQTFMTKLGGGIAIAITGLILLPQISGFRSPSVTNDNGWAVYVPETPVYSGGEIVNVFVQEATTLNWFYALITIIPAISCLVSIIPILKYELTGERMNEINAEMAERRANALAAAAEETAPAV